MKDRKIVYPNVKFGDTEIHNLEAICTLLYNSQLYLIYNYEDSGYVSNYTNTDQGLVISNVIKLEDIDLNETHNDLAYISDLLIELYMDNDIKCGQHFIWIETEQKLIKSDAVQLQYPFEKKMAKIFQKFQQPVIKRISNAAIWLYLMQATILGCYSLQTVFELFFSKNNLIICFLNYRFVLNMDSGRLILIVIYIVLICATYIISTHTHLDIRSLMLLNISLTMAAYFCILKNIRLIDLSLFSLELLGLTDINCIAIYFIWMIKFAKILVVYASQEDQWCLNLNEREE